MAGRRGELVEVDSPRKARNGVPGRTAVYRHVSAKEAYADREGIDNLFDSFATMAEKYPYRKCLGWRASDTQGYTWLTYRETLRWAEKVAAGLDDVGLKAGDRVGVFGANCKELMVVMCDPHCRAGWPSSRRRCVSRVGVTLCQKRLLISGKS